MMKLVVLMAGFVVLAVAQRPPYAGSPDRSYPQVLPQYIEQGSANNGGGSTVGIDNRLGEDTASSAPSTSVPYDPYQAWLAYQASLPREKQSFEYINRHAINSHVGATSSGGSVAPVAPRGSFAGRL